MTIETAAPRNFLKHFKDAEREHRSFVPRSEYLILRLDGKAFHTYTKGLERPFDRSFMAAMDKTALALCNEVSGAVMAYTQSDEISIIVRHQNPESMIWFGGAIQKIVSVAAAVATANFNMQMMKQHPNKVGYFDARVMTSNDHENVADYLNWRRADAMKNSVSMNASNYFSPRELHGLNGLERKEICAGIGKPWEELPAGFKFGRIITKEYREEQITFHNKKTGKEESTHAIRGGWKQACMEDSMTPERIDALTRKRETA